MILRLTRAQVSALECACLDEDTPATLRAWRGSTLHVEAAHVDALASELADLANSEDAQAEECMRLRGGERDARRQGRAEQPRGECECVFFCQDSGVILAGCAGGRK